jgi:hypothetical protein
MKESLRFLLSILLVTLLYSCVDRKQTLRNDAQEIMQELADKTQAIETIDDLLAVKGRLQQLFDELVDVIIKIRSHELHDCVNREATPQDSTLSNQLCQELNRILQIPGAQSIMEAVQRPSLEKLDAFEKKRAMRRQAV